MQHCPTYRKNQGTLRLSSQLTWELSFGLDEHCVIQDGGTQDSPKKRLLGMFCGTRKFCTAPECECESESGKPCTNVSIQRES